MAKTKYCKNCGKSNHSKNTCTDAITSYGVLLIDLNVDAAVKQETIKNLNNGITKYLDATNTENTLRFWSNQDKIRFLMIRRKNTIAYMEFMRGIYSVDNVDKLMTLFSNMVQEELDRLKTKTFDQMWNELWAKGPIDCSDAILDKNSDKKSDKSSDASSELYFDRSKTMIYNREYERSKKKYEQLCNPDSRNVLGLNYYLENTKPKYKFAEWGFPKGRRNYNENNKQCAVREFLEESGFKRSEICVLDKVAPIQETFKGSNGKLYKHVYYLAVATVDKIPTIDPTIPSQYCEIGDICWADYNFAVNLIREQHCERKNILTSTFLNILSLLYEQAK